MCSPIRLTRPGAAAMWVAIYAKGVLEAAFGFIDKVGEIHWRLGLGNWKWGLGNWECASGEAGGRKNGPNGCWGHD